MSVLADETWGTLRALRARPPGRARTDADRRHAFSAALEQAEQFLRAAAAVGCATKPVQLFYALNQAGRAIAAVHGGNPWRFKGHGASEVEAATVGRTTVEPTKSGNGAVNVVAKATDSETWAGPASLGDLWASLPELPFDDELCDGATPALELERDLHPTLHQLPAHTPVQGGVTTRAALRLERTFESEQQKEETVEHVLAPYPRAAGWSSTSGWISNVEVAPQPVWVTWIAQSKRGEPVITAVEALTEEYEGRLYLRPGIGADANVPSLLVTWWAVLLGLSTLSRYEPVVWRRALDIDDSPVARVLEAGLAIAERRLPELVLDAIAGGR